MFLIIKIALRNLLRHKGQSFVIGIILFVGTILMTVGNSVITGMNSGLKDNIVNRFTGDIVLISTNQKQEAVVTGGMPEPIQVISDYTNIKKLLLTQDYIKEFMPICIGVTMVLNERGDMGFTYILGVDIGEYQRFFNSNVILVEGSLLKAGERGILAATGGRSQTYSDTGIWTIPVGHSLVLSNLDPEAMTKSNRLNLQSNIILMGLSDTSSVLDIRTPVIGIIKYSSLNSFWDRFSILDIDSFRECFGYVTSFDTKIKLSKENQEILKTDSLDDLFDADSLTTQISSKNLNYTIGSLKRKMETNISLTQVDKDNGSFNLVFLKLKKGRNAQKDLDHLNSVLSSAHSSVRAISWKKAAGTIGDLTNLLKGILNGFVFFLFVVAIIITANTLSMAALERTTEIGMMRAVGARKNLISLMFLGETLSLSMFFGGAGIVVGAIITEILRSLKLSAGLSDVLALIFGGDLFQPAINFGDIVMVLIQLLIVTFFAVLYPMYIARKITPLEAIARE